MKVKFYSIKRHLAVLLLLSGICNASAAQVLTTAVEDLNFGTSYTQSGSVLRYTYYIHNDQNYTFYNLRILDVIPWGTTYVEGSTEVDGQPWADINNMSPIVDPTFHFGVNIPLPDGDGVLPPGETATVTILVIVDANAGYIMTSYSSQARGNYNVDQRFLRLFTFDNMPIVDDISCTAAYISNAGIANANTPGGTTSANNIISSVNIQSGARLTTVFNGATSINNYYANNNVRLPLTSKLLLDASAIAFDNATQRIYFVNNSTTTQQELYYINAAVSPARAYKFHQTTPYYMNTNTGAGYNITRMTFAPNGVGYALTDNAQEVIRFSVDANNVPVITNLGPLVNANSNGSHLVENDPGGDICADYFGRLHLVTNSGSIYNIDVDLQEQSYPVATYYFTTIGLPTTGNNSVAVGPDGKIVVSGSYQDAYKVNFDTRTATSITGGLTTNVFTSGDYASCYIPQFPWRKTTNNKPAVDKPNNPEAVTNATVQVSPNPFVNTLNLSVALPAAETVRIRLIDLYGRTVYATTEKLTSGVNTVNVNIPGSPGSGIYILDVWAGNKRLAAKKLSHF